jgi:hypothetical protein
MERTLERWNGRWNDETLERWKDETMMMLLLLLNFSLAGTSLALIFRNITGFYSRRLGLKQQQQQMLFLLLLRCYVVPAPEAS